MNVISYSEMKSCENNFFKISIFFEKDLIFSDIKLLSEGKILIFNEKFLLPYFKIIDTNYIIRGSLDTNRITVDFNTSDKKKCQTHLNDILNLFIK